MLPGVNLVSLEVDEEAVEIIVDSVLRRLSGRVQLGLKSRVEVKFAMFIVGKTPNLFVLWFSFKVGSVVWASK